MNIVEQVLGGMSDAALFGLNLQPEQDEIEAGQRDAIVYGQAAERLVSVVGLRKGVYVEQQPIFGLLLRIMSMAGWTYSGSGFFSAAFYKGGLCIKVSLRGSGDAAFDYLHWAKDNGHLAGVPKVYSIGEEAHVSIALMDRYEGARHLLKRSSPAMDSFVCAEYEDVKQALENGLSPTFPSGETALAIREQFPKGNYDMHHGNVMVDRDGGLVITDPLGRSKQQATSYGGYGTYEYTYSEYSQAA